MVINEGLTGFALKSAHVKHSHRGLGARIGTVKSKRTKDPCERVINAGREIQRKTGSSIVNARWINAGVALLTLDNGDSYTVCSSGRYNKYKS